jgi:hypothetical protein
MGGTGRVAHTVELLLLPPLELREYAALDFTLVPPTPEPCGSEWLDELTGCLCAPCSLRRDEVAAVRTEELHGTAHRLAPLDRERGELAAKLGDKRTRLRDAIEGDGFRPGVAVRLIAWRARWRRGDLARWRRLLCRLSPSRARDRSGAPDPSRCESIGPRAATPIRPAPNGTRDRASTGACSMCGTFRLGSLHSDAALQ